MIVPNWIEKGYNKTEDFDFQDFVSPTGIGTSTASGVSILADVESYDYAYKRQTSTGFKVVLGDSSDKPIPNINGLNIAPGAQTLLAFGVTKTYVTNQAKQGLSPMQRGCYDPSEITLKYHKPEDGYKYALTHCLYESQLQNVMKHCNCTPGMFHLRELKKWGLTMKVCIGKSLDCADHWIFHPSEDQLKALRKVEAIENGKMVTKKCLPSCDTDEIKVTPSSAMYPNYALFLERKEVCYIMKKLLRVCIE